MDRQGQIYLLEERYLKAKIAYYEGSPLLTDAEFDAVEQILKDAGSKVVEQVGSKRKDFDFTHPTKMLSLAKIQTEINLDGTTNYQEEIFNKWYEKRRKIIGLDTELLASPKFDGNAINVIYKGRDLFNILTRGDGFTGKTIIKRFLNKVPQKLLTHLDIQIEDIIEIRCEVVIETKIFEEKYSNEFANPRNYVAGVIGRDEEDEIKISELTLIPLHFMVNGEHKILSLIKEFGIDHNSLFLFRDYIQTIKYF